MDLIETLVLHNKIIRSVMLDNISKSSRDSLETILRSNECLIEELKSKE